MIKDEESLKNWMKSKPLNSSRKKHLKDQLNTIKNSSNKGLDQLEKILTQPGYRNLVSKFYSNELVEEILYLIQHYRQSKSKAVEVMEQILKDSDSSLENDKRLSLYCNMLFFCDQKLNKISLEM